MDFKKFFMSLLCFFSPLLGLILILNIIIDPYGLVRLIEVKAINQQKEGVRLKIRTVKMLEMPLRNPTTILLGSSRVHDGVNPEMSVFEELQPVYNLGIDMLRIKEAREFLEHAILNSKIENIIFGIDFFMFNAYERVNPTFNEKLIKRISFADYLINPIVYKDVWKDSWKTIRISFMSPARKEFLKNGFRPGNMVFFGLRDYQKLFYYTNWIFMSEKGDTPYYGKFKLDDEVFNEFEKILHLCKQKRINCILYITPAHAILDGEVVDLCGLWDMNECWKRRITSIADKNGFVMWDFSGYNSITMEEIKTPMRYYWDSSHHTEEVALMMFSKMLNIPIKGAIPSDFGVKIDEATIDDHLKTICRAKEQYRANHKEMLSALLEQYHAARSGKSLAKERTRGMFQ